MQLIFDGWVTLNDPRGLNLNYFDDTNGDGVYNRTSFRSRGWNDKGFNEEQVTFSRNLRFYGANVELRL